MIHQNDIDLSNGSETPCVWHYDAENKVYRLAALLPNGWLVVGGTWDEKSQTMTWDKYSNSSGFSGSGVHRFIDKDHAEWTFVAKNPQGEVVLKLSGKQIRREGSANADNE